MAIDSQAKRMAAAGAGRVYMRATLANGIDAEQRSSIGLSYPVASFSAAAPAENRFNRGLDRPFCRSLQRTDTDE